MNKISDIVIRSPVKINQLIDVQYISINVRVSCATYMLQAETENVSMISLKHNMV